MLKNLEESAHWKFRDSPKDVRQFVLETLEENWLEYEHEILEVDLVVLGQGGEGRRWAPPGVGAGEDVSCYICAVEGEADVEFYEGGDEKPVYTDRVDATASVRLPRLQKLKFAIKVALPKGKKRARALFVKTRYTGCECAELREIILGDRMLVACDSPGHIEIMQIYMFFVAFIFVFLGSFAEKIISNYLN